MRARKEAKGDEIVANMCRRERQPGVRNLVANGKQNLPYKQNLQSLGNLEGKIPDVFSILGREEDRLDASPEGTNELLLNSSNSRDSSPKRNLALN